MSQLIQLMIFTRNVLDTNTFLYLLTLYPQTVIRLRPTEENKLVIHLLLCQCLVKQPVYVSDIRPNKSLQSIFLPKVFQKITSYILWNRFPCYQRIPVTQASARKVILLSESDRMDSNPGSASESLGDLGQVVNQRRKVGFRFKRYQGKRTGIVADWLYTQKSQK